MENKHVLMGIQFVTTANTTWATDTIYFVRTNEGKTDGYIYFNGKKYGTAEDLKTVIGTLPEGFDTWKAFIDSISGATSANTEAITTLNGADTVDGSVAKKIKDALDALDTTEHTAAEGDYVKSVKQEDGKVTVEYGTLPTESDIDASGDTLVSAEATGHTVEIKATDALTSAVANANSAVQNINGLTGTAITLTSSAIEIGAAITSGETTVQEATAKVSDVLSNLYAKTQKNADDLAVLNGVTISDVKYDSANNKIYLLDNNGSTTTGFDASAFVVDGMLDNVELVNEKPAVGTEGEDGYEAAVSEKHIKLTWNTDAGSKVIYLNVNDLVDVYTADETTLHVENNKFSAKTDVEGGVASYSALTSLETIVGKATVKKDDIVTSNGTGLVKRIEDLEKAADAVDYDDIVEAEGDTLVSASATNNKVTVEATDALTNAVANANSAVQNINGLTGTAITLTSSAITVGEDIVYGEGESVFTISTSEMTVNETFEAVLEKIVENEETTAASLNDLNDKISGVTATANTAVQSVNGNTGTAVTIDASEIELGSAITSGETTIQESTAKVSDTLADIYSKIASAAKDANITSTGKTVTITDGVDGGKNLEVNLETATDTTVEAGHIEIAKNSDGGLYGVMYYGGDDIK